MSHSVHHTMLWIVSYVMVLPSEPQKPANNRYSFLHIQFCLPCRFPSRMVTHPFVLDTPLYHSIKLYIPRQRMCLCSRRSSKICQSKNHWANGPSSSSSFSWSVSSSRSPPSLTPPWTARQLYHTLQQNLLHFDWWHIKNVWSAEITVSCKPCSRVQNWRRCILSIMCFRSQNLAQSRALAY